MTIMYGLIAVLVLQTILAIIAKDTLIESYAKTRNLDVSREIDRTLAESGAPAYVAIALGSLVIFGGLLALCAVFLARGANWARIVATVIAALNVLGLVGVFVQPAPAWYKILGVLSGLLGLGLLVLLYRSDASAFFRGRDGSATAPQRG